MVQNRSKFLLILILLILFHSCSNNPYKKEDIAGPILLSAYSSELKYVDPVKSYYSYEATVIDQIYESLFQYHYLKRPYQLIPCLAEEVPEPVVKDVMIKEPYQPRRFDRDKNEIFQKRTIQAISYTIRIKKDIYYAPHPSFTFNKEKKTNTRRLKAGDFLYAFKRIADPKLACPIFPVLVPKIVGLLQFYQYNKEALITIQKGDTLESIALKYYKDKKAASLISRLNKGINNKDLKPGKTKLLIKKPTDYSYPVSGIIIHDDHTLEILLKESYPQILYWLAMHFTAPMPKETIAYYRERDLKNQSEEMRLAIPFYLPYPVGTGPYILASRKPRYEIVLKKNPLFRNEFYPEEGMQEDRRKGLLDDAGKRLPFIDKIIFKYNPEYISVWNKFNQGYLDASGIGKEHFDRIIGENKRLSDRMRKKGVRLESSGASDIFYYGFNMLDPVIGGYSEKKRYLRQAIARAFNVEQYKKIFRNRRGIIPQSPVPPGIFGFQEKVESYNNFDLKKAKELLIKAGYKDGIDPATGKPLEITYDTAVSSGDSSASRPHLKFFKEQIEMLGIKVRIAATDLNTYRKKILDGNYQIFESGWLLDYPDPENFMFLLYGPNGTVKHHADNRANYDNPQFNELFEKMETMENTDERFRIIVQMSDIVNRDCPWIYLFHSEDYYLFHKWYQNVKVTDLINNSLKYKKVDPPLRMAYIKKYNKPVYWPVLLFFILLGASFIPAILTLRRKYR
ncbi:MAG: LysM peptidoglycan-binding domain-containing protein [Spirochaetes bacterium]|nr:LysM peptidoglycan-binding domain-containing protein [Spirochaetota bacterium]